MNTTPAPSGTRIGMPLEEFLAESARQPFELINGEKKPIMPTIAAHSEVIRTIFLAIYSFLMAQQRSGEVYSETTFILPGRYGSDWVAGSRTPDVMFYQDQRMAAYKNNQAEWQARPFELVPDLAIEVVSTNDRYVDIDEKIESYLADGVRMVWVVDPHQRKVTVYEVDEERPLIVRGDGVLDGGDVLLGFKLALAQVFGQLEK